MIAASCAVLLFAGCHALGLPSDRYHPLETVSSIEGRLGLPPSALDSRAEGVPPGAVLGDEELGVGSAEVGCEETPRIALLAPILAPSGHLLCRLCGVEPLPDPPPYPRFHPLPTRPVFEPRGRRIVPVAVAEASPIEADVPPVDAAPAPPSQASPSPTLRPVPSGENEPSNPVAGTWTSIRG
ncbi:MAG: hypothetical protein KatS3mg111_2224 [Pirellulaceae bacterium]|nr:MAG: hypothetical protein KatS3mg111_2224 [Pirellulaceae bacterium]